MEHFSMEMQNTKLMRINHRGILKFNINEFLCSLYILFSIFTPYDTFYIKKIALVLLIMLNFKSFIDSKSSYDTLVKTFVFVCIPFSVVISLVNGSNGGSIISESFNSLYFLLIVVAIDKRLSIRKSTIFALKVLSFVICFCAFLDITGLLDLYNNGLLKWMHNTGNAMVGKSSSYWSYYIIFFKSSPLLFYLLFDSVKSRKYLWTICSFAALLFTGTRANSFVAIVSFVIYLFFNTRKPSYRLIYSLFAIILCVFFAKDFLELVEAANVIKAGSDAVRISDLSSVLNMFKSHPIYLLTGSGIGSSIYITSRSMDVVNIELSYWNMLRQFGLVITFVFLSLWIYQIVLAVKQKSVVVLFTIISYMVICYTNPFLFGSTASIVLLLGAEELLYQEGA